ncbi:MAG TPA: hypothetical protein VJ873_09755, partial [bacterium]|nr:hypothetical protein [bacterium]
MNLQEKTTISRLGVSIPLWAMGLIPAILTAILYSPVLTNGFVNWDDDVYILNNPHIQSFTLSNSGWMFTNFFAGFVIPFYWLSLALDHWIAGPSPWIYHLDNLLLHCANTFLVFMVSFKILRLGMEKGGKTAPSPGETAWTKWSALGAALVFGMHPLHVESVAWAAERKDLLCGFFFLLAIGAYLSYAASPRPDQKKYWACLLLFLAALLSKPMAISFPFILPLLDFWPLQRRDRTQALWEKTPFFALSALVGLSVVYYQFHSGQGIGLNQLPMDFRVMNSFHSAILYLWKLLVPTGLCTFYPIFIDRTFSPEYWTTALLFLGLTWAGFRARKNYPYCLVAWLYFLVTLVPVLGLVQNNSVAHADRYTYLPTLAPILL